MSFETPDYIKTELARQRQEEFGKVRLKKPLQIDMEEMARTNFPHGKFLRDAHGNEYILDENGRTIILAKRDESGKGFSSFYSPLTPKELRRELLALPENQQNIMASVLELAKPDQDDIQEFEIIRREREKKQQLLNEALKLPSAFRGSEESNEVDQGHVRGIIQKEYAITDSKSEKPIIGTYGLGSCIALTIYDRENRVAAIAHIDGTTRIESLGRVFDEFDKKDDSVSPLEIRLIGGNESSRKMAIEILEYLKNRRDCKLVSTDILGKEHPSAFVINAENGAIIPNITPIDNGNEVQLRMQASGIAINADLRKEFDGRVK